jgi:hypothetical protein
MELGRIISRDFLLVAVKRDENDHNYVLAKTGKPHITQCSSCQTLSLILKGSAKESAA